MNDIEKRINKMLKKSEVILQAGKPHKQTNEEWLKQSTTEMLAVAIFKAICISAEMIHCEITLENRSGTELKEAIYEWLQQPHQKE